MSDILCRVCSEPWDAYGVHHGDMMAWEAKLFKAGAGCPSCRGVSPEGETAEQAEERSLASAETMAEGWDDPDSFGHVLDMFAHAVGAPMPKRAPWVAPSPEVVWTCHGCKAQAVKPLAYSLSEPNKGSAAWLEWANGEKVHYMHGIAFARGDTLDSELHADVDQWGRACTIRAAVAHDKDEAITIAGELYCNRCAGICQAPDCSTPVFLRSDLDPGDPYEPGASYPSSGNVGSYGDTLCTDCMEKDSSPEDEGE